MPLKDLYREELAKRQAVEAARCASFEEAKARLTELYRSIVGDRELMEEIRAEVELLDDDLRIDPGPIMIIVTALPTGDIRLEYEVKRAGDYRSTVLPDVKTIDDAERAIARLLAEYGDDEK
jgi:hypothetical protein